MRLACDPRDRLWRPNQALHTYRYRTACKITWGGIVKPAVVSKPGRICFPPYRRARLTKVQGEKSHHVYCCCCCCGAHRAYHNHRIKSMKQEQNILKKTPHGLRREAALGAPKHGDCYGTAWALPAAYRRRGKNVVAINLKNDPSTEPPPNLTARRKDPPCVAAAAAAAMPIALTSTHKPTAVSRTRKQNQQKKQTNTTTVRVAREAASGVG